MNDSLVDKIAQAVLYEGYILYPYRRSTKNQQRWTFGCLFPESYTQATGNSDPCQIVTHCLLRASAATRLQIRLRFLHLVDRTVAKKSGDQFESLAEIEIDGKRHQSWQEAIERTVRLDAPPRGTDSRDTGFQPVLTASTDESFSSRTDFAFGDEESVELLTKDCSIALLRTQKRIEGLFEIETSEVHPNVYLLTARAANLTPLPDPRSLPRDRAQLHAMASTHLILEATDGQFVSMIDPPVGLADIAKSCKQQGAWPVLVGLPGQTDTMLASPIILYDYPQIAPESPGDLFDGTEIDEILSLRVMTLTDDEKRQAIDLDPRLADLLRRTETLAREQLMRLHGTMRPPRKIEAVHVADAELRPGDRVRLRPRGRADAFDIILRGKTATIIAIEQDYENRIHLAVTIDDDPGADIGEAGQVGHRFFFGLVEVEPIGRQASLPAAAAGAKQ